MQFQIGDGAKVVVLGQELTDHEGVVFEDSFTGKIAVTSVRRSGQLFHTEQRGQSSTEFCESRGENISTKINRFNRFMRMKMPLPSLVGSSLQPVFGHSPKISSIYRRENKGNGCISLSYAHRNA